MTARAALLALLLALPGCIPPNQHNETRDGVVAVWFGPEEWASSYRDVWRAFLPALSALGPTFREASSAAEPGAIVVRHFDAWPGCPAAARWVPGARAIEIDPVCAAGEIALRAVLGHELGHAVGMAHVRHAAGDACTDCGPTGPGEAMMNPALYYGDSDGPDTAHAFTGAVPQDTPTDLDLAEYRRVHP
jgi:hypothetical protein